jgi:hypothetical protein
LRHARFSSRLPLGLAALALATGCAFAVQAQTAAKVPVPQDCVRLAEADAAAKKAGKPVHGKLEPLDITSNSGVTHFKVEVVDTEASRERGLMCRTAMPADHGMLFDFKDAKPVSFWMKNTLIPLDMLFIDENGRIVAIAHGARPLDESPIGSGAPVLGVLEINGAQADKDRVQVGDYVKNRIFPPR